MHTKKLDQNCNAKYIIIGREKYIYRTSFPTKKSIFYWKESHFTLHKMVLTYSVSSASSNSSLEEKCPLKGVGALRIVEGR